MLSTELFARSARKLMRKPVRQGVTLQPLDLESRLAPSITGVAFRDFNFNGTLDTTATLANAAKTGVPGTVATAVDVGLANITVTAIPATGPNVVATTAADGTYTLTTAANTPYRIEFSTLPTGYVAGPHGATGTRSGTAVQFAADGATDVNFNAVRASDYFNDNPIVATSLYNFGTAVGNAAPAIVSFNNNAGSIDQGNSPNASDPLTHALSIPASQVGTTFGLGYNRPQNTIYAASYTKRHSGWGPGGAGTIYRMNIPSAVEPSVTNATAWLSLDGLTVTNATTGGTFTASTLGTFGAYATARSAVGYDFDTDGGDTGWDAVGKMGLGGLDVSDDGQFVYVMNLGDRRLYVVPVNANGSANTAAGAIRAYDLPTVTGATSQANVRPFAVEFHEGQVYLGFVDTAETSNTINTTNRIGADGNRSLLRGYVYRLDATAAGTGAFSAASVVSDATGNGFRLNYERGDSYAGDDDFNPWTATYRRMRDDQGGATTRASQYPQAMITGLAFDTAGNLTLGLRDRGADGTGYTTLSDPSTTAIRVEGVASGDILKAFIAAPGAPTTSSWRLEQNAANPTNGAQVGTGVGNNQGPLTAPGAAFDKTTNPGGEYYGTDSFGTVGAGGGHHGTSAGGVAQAPGFPDAVNTHFDPVPGGDVRSGGVRWFQTGSGTLVKNYQLYGTTNIGDATFGKANGVGEIVFVQTEAPPVEVGNRVFFDDNRNGIQDATEDGVAGVAVQLWWAGADNAFGTADDKQIANVVTDGTANGAGTRRRGNYYFNNGAVPAGATPGTGEAYGIEYLASDRLVVYQRDAGGAIVIDKTTGKATVIVDQANPRYQVRIPNAVGAGQQNALGQRLLTTFQVGGGTNAVRDSDAQLGTGTVAATTAVLGGASGFTFAGLTTSKIESVSQLDAGFAKPLFLGNQVFEDQNNDGTLNGADAGIDGVSVRLYAAGDLSNTIQTAVTAAGGFYQFSGLQPGQYVVEIAAPAGYRSSSGTAFDPVTGPFESGLVGNPVTNSTDHGKQFSGSSLGGVIVRANTVTLFDPTSTDPVNKNFQSVLGPNDANLVQDFGLYKVFSLGNRVWRDANNDGLLNDGLNPGIDGVTVRLFTPADFDATTGVLIAGKAPIFSTATAAGGYYRFDDLPAGTYVPAVDTASVPLAGLASSTGGTAATTKYELAAGALPAPGTTDSDDNGSLRGTLVRAGAFVLGPTANAPVGEADVVAGANPQGTVSNQADMTADFGFFTPQSLGNRVFNDLDNDGKFGGADAGLDGVTVRLFRADSAGTPIGAALETQTTNNGGHYLFTGLGTDTYTVEIDGKTLPAGVTWYSSTGQNGSALSGPYEPAQNPNVNRNDLEDHGSTFQNNAAAYLIRSGPVFLSPGTAPTGEAATAGVTDATPDTDSNLTVDFGVWQPLSLGNFVWTDANNNGKFDPVTETGLAGVPVSLFLDNGDGVFDAAADTLVGTVNTADSGAAGFYLFTNLGAGNYFVSVAPPAGYVSSTGKNGFGAGPYEPAVGLPPNSEDHGTQVGPRILSNLVTLSPGTAPTTDGTTPSFTDPAANNSSDLTVDFGLFQPLSVGDFVWRDTNNNGVFDAGETGLDGVPVTLLDGTGNIVATTTTAAGGAYLFTNLTPGDYQVRLTPGNGLKSSTGTGYEPGVNGTEDKQDHGTQAGDDVVGGVFTLGLPGTQSNPDGGFANLRQDFGLFTPIPPTLTLGDLVFVDTNNNGVLDGGESGLDGVPVDLLDNTGSKIATTTTAGGGLYQFAGLQPGTYQVLIRPPAPYTSSTGGGTEPGVTGTANDTDHGTQQTNGSILAAPVTLAAPFDPANPDLSGLGNLRQDFGIYIPTYQLGNFVWTDANNNGLFDAGESPLGGVTVTLTKAGAAVGTTTTAADGSYLFSGLRPGNYTVTVTPGPFQATSTGTNASPTGPFEPGVSGTQNNQDHGTAAGAGISASVTIVEGTNPDGTANLRQDFGVFTPISYGNTVWTDTNNNGILDAGEKTVSGVTAQLVQGGTVVATSVTGTDGKYIFTNVIPGTYTVQIVAPPGTVGSTPSFDPLNTVDNQNIGATTKNGIISSNPFALTLGNAPLIAGNTNPNNYVTGDFGLVPTPIAAVSGFVYLDPNVDGKFTNGSNGDRPIGGVTVTLTGNGLTRTTTTDSKGFYQFTALPPGTYTVRETQPGGQIYDGLDTLGSLGGTTPGNDVHTVTLAAGDAGTDYNFGEIPPAGEYGYVWVDANRNCVYDPGEPTLAGVPITISGTAFAGTVLARPLTAADVPGGLTVFTDSTGRYSFPVLPPGTYTTARGDLTPDQQIAFADWCLQQGDPAGNTPGTNGNSFTGVIATSPTPIRGPFNFGVVARGTSTISDPTKQNFLGSTPGVPPVTPLPPGQIPPPGGPTRPAVNLNPTFATTTGTPTRTAFVVAAAGAGLAPEVRAFDYASGIEKFRFLAYEAGFTGGVRTATADVDGDGTEDIVTATGVGGGPRVRVFSGVDGSLLKEFFAYEADFRGGVFVAAADIDGDGKADIITGTEVGGGPRTTVFSGATGAVLQDFFAFDQAQRGGVRVAAADFNGDGRADIVATTGTGVPTRVRVFDGRDTTLLTDYAPYEASYTGGVNIAAADFNGDGTPDIIVGAETGGGPRVQVFSGLSSATLANFFAYEDTFTGGVRVAATDVDGDGKADLTVTPGAGGAARVRVLRATDLSAVDDFYAFGPEYVGGLYVG